jgi:hypothetical protein
VKTPRRIGRRHFLMGAGGATLAIPVLGSLLPRGDAQAGGLAGPERNFVSWRITNGQFGHQWYPSDASVSAGGGLQLVEPNVREMMLADIPGPISPILHEGFDPFREKMTLLRHIDRLDQSDHDAGNGLFGWRTDEPTLHAGLPPSIDQLVAQKVYGGMYVPLNLSVRWSEVGASCSMSVTQQGNLVVEPGLYPAQAFQQLFVGFDVDDVTAERLRQQRLTLVDRALSHYQAVRGNPRLSSADKDLLDEHIQHMFQVEQLLASPAIECVPPTDPGAFSQTPEAVNAAAQAQVDIAVAAMRCGITRVVNFYLDPDVLMNATLHGVSGGHHGASHDASEGSVESILNAHLWHMDYLLDFIGKLDASIDPLDGSTLLDSSLILVNNEIGNQNGASGNQPGDLDLNHIGLDGQTMLIGSAGGRLRTGMLMDYRTDFTRNRWSQYIGTSYNWVLVTCMLAMGLEPEDWEVDGQPGFGDMRGAPYDMTPAGEVVVGDLRAYLPRLQA